MDYDSPTTERQKKAVNQAKKIFLLLLAGGLSIGVVKLMNYFGLTEKSNQIEIIQDKLNQ